MPGRDDEVEYTGENDPAKSASCWLLNAIKPVAPQAGIMGRIILREGNPLRDEGNWADFLNYLGEKAPSLAQKSFFLGIHVECGESRSAGSLEEA